jgi:hypothetical protein
MKKIILVLLIFSSCPLWAQKSVYQGFPSLLWPKLYNITFITERDDLGEFQKPVFTEAVKSLHNKRITLPGYMVPLENTTTSAKIMLSSLPLNACFFCGVGGPETVVEVHLRSKTSYIEKPIEISGILKLNDKDPDQMIYILDDAEVMGTIGF